MKKRIHTGRTVYGRNSFVDTSGYDVDNAIAKQPKHKLIISNIYTCAVGYDNDVKYVSEPKIINGILVNEAYVDCGYCE